MKLQNRVVAIFAFTTILSFANTSFAQFDEFKDFPIKISRVKINIEEGKKIGFSGGQKLGEPFPYGNIVLSTFDHGFRQRYDFYENDLFFEKGIKSTVIEIFTKEGFNLNKNNYDFAELEEYVKPKLAITIHINDFVYNMRGSFGASIDIFRSFLDLKIQVLSLTDNTIVFERSIQDEYFFKNYNNKFSFNFRYVFNDALHQGIKNLIYNEEFTDVILDFKEKKTYENEQEAIIIPKVSLNKDMNAIVKKSLESTVTISLGRSIGSGAFITKDGLILTCSHVVGNAKECDIILSNNIKLKGKIIRNIPDFDLALVQVEGIEAIPLPLGKSLEAEPGDEVFTIGTPSASQLGQSVSKGIISGKRVIDEKSFIQTDANVNPGNSGGPLINKKGEIIGVVNMKIIRQGTEGIGFAIPVDVALEKLNIVVNQ
jgi:hypothetical protein